MPSSDTIDRPASVTRRPAPTAIAALTATEGLAALEQGRLTCEAWTRACLDRIDERNAGVKAWVRLDADGALARAREWDRHGRRRLLDGVPLGIKDTIDTADMPTELGDPEIFPGRQPEADAPVVTQAHDLGFNVLGKNTVSRHAIMLPGPARNPHDLNHTPAASSAGSAAAVADFMTPLSIGTQTAGSILRPSAFCGAVGFKPTLDAIPYVGIRRYSRVLDVIGPIARSVDDAALFMRAFTGDPRFGSSLPVRTDFRVGVWRPKDWADTEPCMQESFVANLRALSAAGVTVTELTMPAAFDTMGEAQDVIMAYDLAREYAALKRDHAHLCDPGLIDYLNMGEGLSAADYAGALDAADACRRAFYDAARDVDAVVMPSTLGEAPLASSTGSSAFIRIWSLLHNPSITLPVARGPNGLPLGFQMVGFVKEDARLLYWARCAERILGSTAHQA
ncbi:amidase [Achromobacter pestifer]|uniref:Mandelamide hydrolase n=1 Tax=Achromobacter pestifer TaxID=1353889 RepID=A0A6S6YR60_9BURK|nr:amidase [Achromobacter pestifer]CAB3630411.1 Mandelamide hydrolase [Achromobacter pestifer]